MRATDPNTENRLLKELPRALETLEQTTGVKGRVVQLRPQIADRDRPDAEIVLQINGEEYPYLVEAKTQVDRFATLGNVKAQLDRLGHPGLLFTPQITTAQAKQCRQLDLAFLDLAGNAFLRQPGTYIYITGEKLENPEIFVGRTGAGTATALRVTFALLCKPDLLNAPYRDIVEAANVALGAIGWVFFDLEKRGYIAGGQKNHNRRFLEPLRVFDEWVTNYPIKLRPKLNARRFLAENPDWWKQARLEDVQAYWGGEVAAERLTQYLKPANCTIYVARDKNHPQGVDPVARLVAANRLRADAQGNIEILDAFWNLPPDPARPDVVPPILVYADLIATLDPRNLETAQMIRAEYIDHAFRQV
jgi:hypothetical protein